MIGSTLGSWIIDAEVGHGPNGTVYQAHATSDPGRIAAIKILTHPSAREPDFLARFPAEMLTLQRLNHPNVARFYDSGVHGSQAWYASEWVDGTNCQQLLTSRTRNPETPGLYWAEMVMPIAVQVARAIRHGHHRSLLHRSIKPANVLVAADGTTKVTDFGIAKFLAIPPLNLPADPWGTIGYLAPEHFIGQPLTRKTDLYALGGLLYTLIAGRPLFLAETTIEFQHKHRFALPDRPALFAPDLSPDFDELICTLLEKNPSRRPAAAVMVLEELASIRGKCERKGRTVGWPPDGADPSETFTPLADDAATIPTDRPLMSRAIVVIPLFLLVVGLSLWLLFRPRPSAEELITAARPLLKSSNPSDWERAWEEYLVPLEDNYPGQYPEEIAAARARVEARRELRLALEVGRRARLPAESEQFFQQGLREARAGETAAARRTWELLILAFDGVEAAADWVNLAKLGLTELQRRPATTSKDRPQLQEALERAQRLQQAGDPAAASVFKALEELYRDHPEALAQIQDAR